MNWLKKLTGQRRTDAPVASPIFSAPLQVAHRLAIVGDVHGRDDLLEVMLWRLSQETLDRIVFVGDFVDRGEQSAQALIRLKQAMDENPNILCLRGNHEKMLLDFLDRPQERGLRWMRNGGLQTLASFGLTGLRDTMAEDEMEAVSGDFRRMLPEGMEDWIRAMPLTWQSGNLWVVHGAADPSVPMSEQKERVLLWGHRHFEKVNRADGQWVAHGHTIFESAKVDNGRISVDTGAYATGKLSAAVVSPDEQLRFLHT